MDDVELGRIRAQRELPEPVKFAWPIMLIPELFTTPRHLALVLGYLASIGWEVFVPNLRAAFGKGSTPALEKLRFNDLAALAGEALDGIGRDAVVLGHGVGGLVALKLSEHRRVKAAVAYAPLVPGFSTPLVGGVANRLATMLGRSIKPPRGRVLFELIADSDPFTRDGLINAMVPDSGALATDVSTGAIDFAAADKAAPRLVVAGDSDIFAPLQETTKFAESIGAKLAKIPGRGHWLIGGRALERAINETQRFLVRALGQDLLLLYPEEWKNEPRE
ncbi:MAG TPA: alpha/beta fold hydrolase [Candidatus Binatus sp.]|uniref:alpha/beta hydrolase n=1 Tax=Candidatus Binatus sp. TaxID=2811406 RepID=UPI002B4756A5|nr:alpha/beta fold hydrolase [Candidatus Binatus sp.]HKN12529.1 alpha/beta fold hydrolase [Candidatus Binatus sp.]